MNLARRIALVLLVSIACVGCDQTTKSIAQRYLPRAEAWSYLGDTVRLQLTRNRGAFLSLGESLPAEWRHVLFSVGVGVLLLAILACALFVRRLPAIGVLGLALYVAGGGSNLIDRLQHGGHVIDFINVGVGPLRTGVFNVADLCIVAGAVAVVVAEAGRRKRAPAVAPS